MATVFLFLQSILLLVCILLNALHFMTVLNVKRMFKPAEIARILPSGFLIMITMTMVPIEVYTFSSEQGYNTNNYNLIADEIEFLQIATLLGLSLLGAITKLRSYKCKGSATIAITRKSVIIPAFVIVACSITITTTLCLYRPLMQNRTDWDANYYIESSVELFIYYIFEIIPTMAVYITIFIYALQYYTGSSKSLRSLRARKSMSQRRQFQSVAISVLLYIITFAFSWIPFFTFKIITLVSSERFKQLAFDNVILCLKLALFSTYPVSDGMLLKRSRKKLRLVFVNISRFPLQILRVVENLFITSIPLKIVTPTHPFANQLGKETVSISEHNEFMNTGRTFEESNKDMMDIDNKEARKEIQLSYRRQMRTLPKIELHVPLNTPADLDSYISPDLSGRIYNISGNQGIQRQQRDHLEISQRADIQFSSSLTYDSLQISPSFDIRMSHSARTSPYDQINRTPAFDIRMCHSTSTSPYDHLDTTPSFDIRTSYSANTSPCNNTARPNKFDIRMSRSTTTSPFDHLDISPSIGKMLFSNNTSTNNTTKRFFRMNIRRYSESLKTDANFSQKCNKTAWTTLTANRFTFSPNSISKLKRFDFSSSGIMKILQKESENETLLASNFNNI